MNNTLLKLVVLIFILQSFSLSQKEYSIKGIVKDAADGEPLPGVEVFAAGMNSGTTTDLNGEFSLTGLDTGSYEIRFSFIGYATEYRTFTVPGEDYISINMKTTAVKLDEVVITGNPFLSDPREISQTTNTLNKTELIIKGGHSVAEALNFQPGIAMRSNGIATGRPVIRGFSDNKVLLLQDGLRMGDLSNTSDDHSVSDDGSQPDKIEVLQGPSSLLYGSGAVGGVVNIITDAIPTSVENGFHGEVITHGASVNSEYLGNVHVNYGTGMLALHGKVFKRKGTNYSIPGGGSTPGSDLDSYGTQAGISLHPGWGITGLSYTGFNNKYGLPVNPDGSEEAYIKMEKDQYRAAADIYKINSLLTSMSFKGAYINYNHKEIAREDGTVETEFGMKTYTADISFTHKPFSSITNGVIGLYALAQEYTVTGEEAITPNSDNNSFAVYFYEKLKLTDITFSFGARYEYNEVKIPEAVLFDSVFNSSERRFGSFSASVGVTYNLLENTSFYMNIANAFRAPSVEELSSFGIHKAAAVFDSGNRKLKEERTIGIDAGIRSRYSGYYFEFTGYYNRITNLIYKQPSSLFYLEDEGFNTSGEGYRVYNYLQSKAVIYGLQGQFSYELLRNFTSIFTADYVKAENLSVNENIAMIPPFRFSTELRYSLPNFWSGLEWNLTAPQNEVAPEEEPTPGYGVLSVYGGIKLLTGDAAHVIDLKVKNVLNQPYKDHLSSIKHFTYMPGRNVILSYRLLF